MKTNFSLLLFIALLCCNSNLVKAQEKSTLMIAVEKGQVDVVRGLLDQGADVNEKSDFDASTALMRAISWAGAHGQDGLDIVKVLINKGADVNLTSKAGEFPLRAAVQSNSPEIAKILLDNGAKVDLKNSFWGHTAMMWAAQLGHPGVVKVLLDKGADVNTKDKSGKTALIHTAWSISGFKSKLSHLITAKILLANDAEIITKDKDGKTVLTYATAQGADDMVQFLLKFQSEGNNPEGKAHKEAAYENLGRGLIETVSARNLQQVKSTIDRGADVNYIVAGENFGDCTPLILAAKTGNIEITKILLEKGADPDVKINGSNPLASIEYDPAYSPETKKLFKEYQRTAPSLFSAIEQGDTAMVVAFLKQGADVNQKKEATEYEVQGITPLMWAASFGKADMVKTLLARGADMSASTSMKYSPAYKSTVFEYVMLNDKDKKVLTKEATDKCMPKLPKNQSNKDSMAQYIKCFEEFYKDPKIKLRQDAIDKKTKEIIKTLLDWCAKNMKADLPGVIYHAVTYNPEIIKPLVTKGYNVNEKVYNIPPLVQALRVTDIDKSIVDILIANGASIDSAIVNIKAHKESLEKATGISLYMSEDSRTKSIEAYQRALAILESKRKKIKPISSP